SAKSFCLELVMYFLVVVLGFITSTTIFSAIGYEKELQYIDHKEQSVNVMYKMPTITVPKESIVVADVTDTLSNGLLELPPSIDAPKLNTILWSFLIGSLLYVLIRLVTRRTVSGLLKPLTNRAN